MAADQWRKRLNSTSVVTCYGREPRAKRKSNMKSHISLEWDGNRKKVVARRDQVGISWRDMRSFTGSPLSVNNVVADVLTVPQEIYALENLSEVLSYEVWEDVLSESERNYLMEFLPKGIEIEQVVQSLLAGDNIHFGSPLPDWGSSLCSGNLHPDAISQQQQYLINEKKAYYSELHKYHNNMIGNLLKLKESFEHHPEKDIVLKTSRSGKDVDKGISSSVIETRFNALEGNVVFSSESCSWEADEKACSSDNQKSSIFKGGDFHNRSNKKDAIKEKAGNFSAVSSDVLNVGIQSRKGEKRHEHVNLLNDGAKYMSYIKISKRQRDIVKSMKQSGKSIQSKSLNRVLGNIDSFDVRPYEMFVEEERKKLHEKWIQMAKDAVPVACVNWRDLNAKRQQLRKSLKQEIKERLKTLTEDEDDSNSQRTVIEDQIENEIEDRIPTPADDDENENEKSVSGSQEREFSYGKENDSMDVDSEKETPNKTDQGTRNTSENTHLDLGQGAQLACSGDDIWPSATISHTYYGPTDDDLAMAPPKENDVLDLDSEKDLVHRYSKNTPFISYPNQDRNDMLDPFYKGDGMLIYHQDQKMTGLDFQPTESMLIEDPQFPVHFSGHPHQSLPKRENDDFAHGNLPGHVYSDPGRFGILPRPENLARVNPHDWAVNGARVPLPMQPHLTGEFPNWFAGEQQPRWTGAVRNGGDQSLYSVLSQCNQLRSNGSYQPATPTVEQFVPPRNYGMMGGPVNPSMANIQPQSAVPLDYMGGREAGSLMPDDMVWMGLAHPSSGLHDPMGKPYLRSWNQ